MDCLPVENGSADRRATVDRARLANCESGHEPDGSPLSARHRPRRDRICASSASHSRAAFSATASSTGWMSVGELAMTPKISLVAVCCSNDFLEFLEQPHVFDGDHRLVGEGFEQLDLRRGEGTHLDATRVQVPMSSPC